MINIRNSVKAAITASSDACSLQPLMRELDDLLSIFSSSVCSSGFSVVTFDSFCSPHWEITDSFFKSVSQATLNNANILNLPIGHLLFSGILNFDDRSKLARISSRLLAINNSIVSQLTHYEAYPDCVKIERHLSQHQDVLASLDGLFASSSLIIPSTLYLGDCPLHEASVRDLILLHKVDPAFAFDPSSRFYADLLSTNVLIISILVFLVLLDPLISDTVITHSNYSANSLLKYYCDRTNRNFRVISSSNELIPTESRCIRILLSNSHSIEATRTYKDYLSQRVLRSDFGQVVQEYIRQERFFGNHSHVYSPSINTTNKESEALFTSIERAKSQGLKIVSLFTSSLDEIICQQLAFRNDRADLTHLQKPIFERQPHWVYFTCKYFQERAKDTYFVVRFHPRMAADKRGLSGSPIFFQAYKRVISEFGGSENIRLVLPETPVSSYRIGNESDLIINGWSTIGTEFAIMNKKVLNIYHFTPYGNGVDTIMRPPSTRLVSTEHYVEVLNILLGDSYPEVMQSRFLLDSHKAMRDFCLPSLYGLISLDDHVGLLAQLKEPCLITPVLESLLVSY